MNFLSHFFLDELRPEPQFAVGAATPDLLSIFNSDLRVKLRHVKRIPMNELTESHYALAEGIRRHFHADAIFHTSTFFQEEVRHLSSVWEKEFKEAYIPRKFFVAHVLLELIMDKVLIQLNPGILEAYYAHFEVIDLENIRTGTEFITGHKLSNYEHFLEKFRDNRYLVHYEDWNHIVFVLKRILRRVNIKNDAFAADPAFVATLAAYEERLVHNHLEIFKEIRNSPENWT